MFAAKGTFTAKTTTGSQVVPVLLCGMTPKAVIIWGSRQTADGLTSGELHYSFGMATSTTNRIAINGSSVDSFSLAGVRWHDGTAVIIQTDPVDFDVGTEAVRVDLSAFGTNSFTLDWQVADGVADIYHYLAIAGDDVEANIASVAAPTTPPAGPDAQSIPHGLSGVPHAMFGISSHNKNDPVSAPGQDSSHQELSIYATDFTDSRWMGAHRANGDGGYRMQYTWILAHQIEDFIPEKATYTSIDATNMNIYWDPDSQAEIHHYLFLRGMSAKVGTFTSPTTAGNVTISPGFTPRVFVPWGFMGIASTETSSGEADFRASFGASDGTNQGCIGLVGKTDNADRINDSAGVLTVYDHAEAEQETATVAFSGDDVVVTFGTADANLNEWNYLILGGSSEDPMGDIFIEGPAGTVLDIVAWKPV